ncbi:MAG: PilT protein domain-containing protein [Parcubacteria group bacterium Gr01-1014_66]|nr:MAG: PilT protein domain-containing protein [Parcubacteria group bacterium Gr01-1014_66]
MIVLDASVVAKWFKPDEVSSQADFYLTEHTAGRESIAVPTLLLYELTSVLRHSAKLSKISIETALIILFDARLTFVSPDDQLLITAVEISEHTGISIYDASYVALAQRLNCVLVTADKKLAHTAKTTVAITLL